VLRLDIPVRNLNGWLKIAKVSEFDLRLLAEDTATNATASNPERFPI
jgi:hypothetical protein